MEIRKENGDDAIGFNGGVVEGDKQLLPVCRERFLDYFHAL